MKAWKWAALAAAGAVLMQVSTCTTDFAYYLMQAFASQLVTVLLDAVTTQATTTTA
jgi:hypothetical protein